MVRFELRDILATPAALAALTIAGMDFADLLTRHETGDWGQLCDEDCRANERSLQDGGRLLSA